MNNDLQLDLLVKNMARDHQPELPTSGLIWWRAQILRKQREQERIERPVKIMRLVAIVVTLAVFAAEVPIYWRGFQGIFDRQSWLVLPLGIMVLTVALASFSLFRSMAKDR